MKKHNQNLNIEDKILAALDSFNGRSRFQSGGTYSTFLYVPVYDEDVDPASCAGFQYGEDFTLVEHMHINDDFTGVMPIAFDDVKELKFMLEAIFSMSKYGDSLYITTAHDELIVWDADAVIDDWRVLNGDD